jgi:riboflavin biosynthesis pyrimidine reductase
LLEPFEVLFDTDLPGFEMPPDLERIYGRLGFSSPAVYSNFVASIDGVVSLGPTPSAGSVISGKYPADRFLMALLRAYADAVVLGAGTLRATPGHLWTPAHVYPALTSDFTALREGLGRSAEPQLVVLTASGDVDMSHPALVKGALIFTTPAGAGAMNGRLPPTCEVVEMRDAAGSMTLDLGVVIGELQRRGLPVVLTEGGPHMMGRLLEQSLLDEAFLTISPVVAGRGDDRRLGMVEGVELLPGSNAWGRLLSVRRHGEYLFLRYRVRQHQEPS